MASKSIQDVAKKMANLDICMFSTHSSRGALATRPMSNNGDVEYDGDSWFFSYEDASVVKDIEREAHVCLSFQGPQDLYLTIDGTASLMRSKATMQAHWVDSLKQWFKDGVDTKGIVMIHVKGRRIKYWQGEEQDEVKL